MDSDRRHDLETNDLKEFLDNFKDFWDKHGNKVLIVLIVALLAYAGPRYYTNWKEGKANEAANALAGATSAEALLNVADEHELVRDEAHRKAADLLLGDARAAQIVGETEDADKALGRAESAYTALAERGQTTPYQLVGLDGLAKVAVMQGDWDKAKQQYEKIIDLAGETYTYHAARAQAKIDALPRLERIVAFAPPEPVSVEPESPLDGGLGQPGQPGQPGGDGGPVNPALPDLDLPGFEDAGQTDDDTAGETDPVDPVQPVEPLDELLGEPDDDADAE